MNKHFLEKVQIVPAFMPVAMNTAANTGDWVSLKGFGRCAIIFLAGAGTAGDDPTITLQQALTVAGGSPKVLNFTRVDVKMATALATVGPFTTVTQAAGNTYTDATSAELQKMWVVDIKAEDLDINGGYCCLHASIGDVGTNAQLGVCLYCLHEPREAGPTTPSGIVD